MKPIHVVSSDPKLVTFGWHPKTFDFEEFGNSYSQKDRNNKKNNNTKRFHFFRKTGISSFNRWRCLYVWCGLFLLLVLIAAMLIQTFVFPQENPKEFAENWYYVLSHSQADDCGIARSFWTNCLHWFWKLFSFFHRNKMVKTSSFKNFSYCKRYHFVHCRENCLMFKKKIFITFDIDSWNSALFSKR